MDRSRCQIIIVVSQQNDNVFIAENVTRSSKKALMRLASSD